MSCTRQCFNRNDPYYDHSDCNTCPGRDKNIKTSIESNPTYIPLGTKCYFTHSVSSYSQETHYCPYWSLVLKKPQEQNGFCHYLNQGDWEYGTMIWDGNKECNVNIGEENNISGD